MRRESCCTGWKTKAVVALGNPDRADDGVAHQVLSALPAQEGVERLASVKGGLDLALSLLDYEKVLVIDADPALPPGEIALRPLAEEDRRGFRHGLGLAEALAVVRRMGLRAPEVWVLAIGVAAAQPFRRGLSPQVEGAVSRAKGAVEAWLRS